MLVWLFVIVGVMWLDQATKWLLATSLPAGGTPVIPGVLRFTYVENEGMAFGLLSEHRWVFIVGSVVGLAALSYYLFRYRPGNTLARLGLSFIIGGGFGNMIDRVLLGYVIDFIDFCAFPKLWTWVFNVADAFVCVGAGVLVVYLIGDIIRTSRTEKAAAGAANNPAGAPSSDAETTEAEAIDAKAPDAKAPDTNPSDALATDTHENSDTDPRT